MGILNNTEELSTDELTFSRGDHVEIAEALLAQLGTEGPLVFDDGALYQYDQGQHIYVPVPKDRQSRTIQSFAGCRAAPTASGKPRTLSIRGPDVSYSMKLAWDLVTQIGFFKKAPPGIVFEDCFLQVTKEGIQTVEHSPEHRARYGYPFAYEREKWPERFVSFLEEIFRGDEDDEPKTNLILEYCGAALLGFVTDLQRAIILRGEGANGKSVLLKILEAAMPPGSTCAVPPQTWDSEYRLALIAGKKLNLLSELPEADILASEKFKSVVDGTATTARNLYKDPFTMRPVAGHVSAANRLPATDDTTHGFWRRLIVIEHNRIFEEEEQILGLEEQIIKDELPAIVSLLIQAGQRVLARGHLLVPESSEAAVRDWKRNADQITAFVEEECVPLGADEADEQGTPAAKVYEAYKAWAKSAGHYPLARNKFGARMRSIKHGSIEKPQGSFYRLTIPTAQQKLERQAKMEARYKAHEKKLLKQPLTPEEERLVAEPLVQLTH